MQKSTHVETGCVNSHTSCRLYWALARCMQEQTHAEKLVSQLLDHYHYSAELLPFYFFRIRSSGILAEKDFKPKWAKYKVPACDEAMFAPFVEREAALAAAQEQLGVAVEGEEEVAEGGDVRDETKLAKSADSGGGGGADAASK